MEEYVVQGSLDLAHGNVLRIEDGRDMLVYVWEGKLWLTEEGERTDRVLVAGQWHRLERGGTAIANALARCLVTLTAPEPRFFARRIALTRAASAAPVELYSASRERLHVLAAPAARLRRLWARLFAPQARPTTAAL
jgi:hypothetical protein